MTPRTKKIYRKKKKVKTRRRKQKGGMFGSNSTEHILDKAKDKYFFFDNDKYDDIFSKKYYEHPDKMCRDLVEINKRIIKSRNPEQRNLLLIKSEIYKIIGSRSTDTLMDYFLSYCIKGSINNIENLKNIKVGDCIKWNIHYYDDTNPFYKDYKFLNNDFAYYNGDGDNEKRPYIYAIVTYNYNNEIKFDIFKHGELKKNEKWKINLSDAPTILKILKDKDYEIIKKEEIDIFIEEDIKGKIERKRIQDKIESMKKSTVLKFLGSAAENDNSYINEYLKPMDPIVEESEQYHDIENKKYIESLSLEGRTIIFKDEDIKKLITFKKYDLLEVLDNEGYNYLVVLKKQGDINYIFKLIIEKAICIDSFMVTSYKEEADNKKYFEITRKFKKEAIIENKEKYVLEYNSKDPNYIKKCITSSKLQYNIKNYNILNEEELNNLVFNYEDKFLILGSQYKGDELMVDVLDYVRNGIFRIIMRNECLDEFNLPPISIIEVPGEYNDFIEKKPEEQVQSVKQLKLGNAVKPTESEEFGFGETNDAEDKEDSTPEEVAYGGRKSRSRRAKNRKTRRRMRLK
jgi:hypothetical protein